MNNYRQKSVLAFLNEYICNRKSNTKRISFFYRDLRSSAQIFNNPVPLVAVCIYCRSSTHVPQKYDCFPIVHGCIVNIFSMYQLGGIFAVPEKVRLADMSGCSVVGSSGKFRSFNLLVRHKTGLLSGLRFAASSQIPEER